MKKIFLSLLLLLVFFSGTQAKTKIKWKEDARNKKSYKTVTVRLEGEHIFAFNGIPANNGWGRDLVYKVTESTADQKTMGPLGGIPLVDIWNEEGGIAIFNTKTYQEPFSVRLSYDPKGVTMQATGGTEIEVFRHRGDYFEAVRAFALKMKKKGLFVKKAPDWAFDPIWETYGFEEDFDVNTIRNMLPILKKLGIKTITIDSGWYGKGRGEDLEFNTGDFKVNPDTIGSEKDLIDLIDTLHYEGFKVRLWWVPGVAEEGTKLWQSHPEWFTDDVISSTEESGDIYLDPKKQGVWEWSSALVKRFLSYGVDGFKQDDVYHYISKEANDHRDYAGLINANLAIAQGIKKDFVVNTCNCGISQNFYQISGQNQLITSDPVGSKQFRHRAKYLHALNVNSAAILGDHVELSRGDVGPDEMDTPGFYETVDFSSIVPLGLVLQTKFRKDPGLKYRKWFQLYNKYKFYRMEWINIPIRFDHPETYLMKGKDGLFFSFFTEEVTEVFNGKLELTNLSPGTNYQVFDLASNTTLSTFQAEQSSYQLDLNFKHSIVIRLVPLPLTKHRVLKNG